MKFKDYYDVLGVARDASADDIKKAYRKLAHRYHPDVSSDPDGEAKFKDVAEAYATLKDPEKRAAYDQLGRHRPGEDFEPSQGWRQNFGDQAFGGGASGNPFAGGNARFEDVDLSDLFAAFGAQSAGGRARGPTPGQDFEVEAPVTVEQLHAGGEIDLDLALPEVGDDGLPHRVAKTFRVRIPQGAEDGQRLRLGGKGGASRGGGRPGDLYVVLALQPHPLYRVVGRDLYVDLPLAPWEAVLGATVEVPTPGGTVELNVPAGTAADRRLRLAKRGLPTAKGPAGDLYAVVRIEVPPSPDAKERSLYEQLKAASSFDPRARSRGGGAMTERDEVVWLEARTDYSFDEVVELSGLPQSLLDELIECGALPAHGRPSRTTVVFEAESIVLARAASRLREHFELDASGLAVAVSLLRRVRVLEARLARMRPGDATER